MDKLDILLVNAPSAYPGSMLAHRLQGLPPLGLGYIATYVNQFGYKASILDFYIREVTLLELEETLNDRSPSVVGISTSTETYNNGIKIARFIKKMYPEIAVVMGGYHVSFEYKDALDTGYVDYVIRNEGEITFKELLDFLCKKEGEIEEIDGICYIDNQGTIKKNKNRKYIDNLDELPIPDRSFFDMKKYGSATISTSRGCPGNCIFCAATALSGGRYRVRSANSIVQEFKYLSDLGYRHIQIIDDTMTADIDRLNEFLDLMIQEQLDISWNCESRVDIMTKDLLYKMKQAGCNGVQFGVEAGNQEMLDCLKKNITMEQIHNVFIWAKELEILAASCLIIGQPYDTKKTIEDSVRLALELQSLGASIVFSVSTPYPGTYMYNNPEKLGIEIVDHDTDNYTTQIPVYDSKNMTKDEIQSAYFDAFVALSMNRKDDNTREKLSKVKQMLIEEVVGEKYVHTF